MARPGTPTLTGSGANVLTLANGGGEIQTNASAMIAAAIAGPVGLTKTGSGTLTLTGANTYTGGTTISAGVLDLGGGGTTGSVEGNITNNGVLQVNRSNTLVLDQIVSGTGSEVKLGAGTLTVSGVNGSLQHTGGTTISAGTLQVGNGSAFGILGGTSPTTAC